MGVIHIMKKNLLTIIILALVILNMVLSTIIVFTMVPTTMRTNKLIAKVASNIDLEIEPLKENSDSSDIKIEDIEIYHVNDEPLIINLKKSDSDRENHYLSVEVALSINKKSSDYKVLGAKIADYETYITEIITEEFSKYTIDNVVDNKEQIKASILENIRLKFDSDLVINVSLGKFIVE